MRKFYGLTGTKLNIAIAVVAGTDFALFGYGEYSQHSQATHQGLTSIRSGCHGRSLDPRIIPQILPRNRHRQPASREQRKSCSNHPSHHCRRVYSRMLLWRCSHYLAGQYSWTQAHHLLRLSHHDHRRHLTNCCFRAPTIDCRAMDYWLWQRHEHEYCAHMAV